MGLLDLFKSAPTISPDAVRTYIKDKKPDEYLLLDVRQHTEYEQGHLPGARLIPLSELSNRLGDLDPQKQTILYCRSGNRSNSAAGLLIGAGFKDVLNMQGGISRYNGITASGPPEAGLFCFPETLTPGELAAVAWYLEDGTIRFLKSLYADVLSDKTPDIVHKLVEEKELHKQKLAKLYKELTGKEPEPEFPKNVLGIPAQEVMIGCVKVSDAVKWSRGKSINEVLELVLSLTANTYDLYLKLSRQVKSDEARRVFTLLSDGEQEYVERTAKAFEGTLEK